MTRDQIAAGLDTIVLRLGNNEDLSVPPAGLQLHEWAYIKGIASHAILQSRARLLAGGAEQP